MFSEFLSGGAAALLFIGIIGGLAIVLLDRKEWKKWRPSGRSMFVCMMLGLFLFIIAMVLKG